MKFYGSFVLLAIFTSISNAEDICISMSGNTNLRFAGTYQSQGSDSNGNTYYKNTETICDIEYIYKTSSGKYVASDSLGSSTSNLQCPTGVISSPADCGSNWSGGSSVTSSSGACDDTLVCPVIEITNAPNGNDGVYTKIGDNLYQNGVKYFQYLKRANVYVVASEDARNNCGTFPSSSLISYDSQIGGLTVGGSITATLTFPEDTTATINCLETVPISPPLASGNLCFAVTQDGLLFSMNSVEVINFAGPYLSISGGINGKPAYELSGCDGQPTAAIVYDSGYYFIVTDKNDPWSTYVSYCVADTITDDDVTQCSFSSQYYEGKKRFQVSSTSTCGCEQTV